MGLVDLLLNWARTLRLGKVERRHGNRTAIALKNHGMIWLCSSFCQSRIQPRVSGEAQGCGIKGFIPTSVIQGNSLFKWRGSLWGTFFLYHRSGFSISHSPGEPAFGVIAETWRLRACARRRPRRAPRASRRPRSSTWPWAKRSRRRWRPSTP